MPKRASGDRSLISEADHVPAPKKSFTDAEHVTKCAECGGEIDRADHKYSTNVRYGPDAHWRWCTECDFTESGAPHIWSSGWTSNSTYHWRTCTTSGCGGTGDMSTHVDEDHDSSCDVCNAELEGHAHTFDINDWIMTEAEHWHSCAICGEALDVGGHALDWRRDQYVHWMQCATCGYRGDASGHDWGDKMRSNEIEHWYECSVCTSITDRAPHVDGDGDEVCDFCGNISTVFDYYQVTTGAGQQWDVGSGGQLSFATNIPRSSFKGAAVDGQMLSTADFRVTDVPGAAAADVSAKAERYVVLTLEEHFLRRLSDGVHKLEVYGGSLGSAKSTFTVNRASGGGGGSSSGGGGGGGGCAAGAGAMIAASALAAARRKDR